MPSLTDNEIHTRLEALMVRRQAKLTNIKYRGKLKAHQWNYFQAN